MLDQIRDFESKRIDLKHLINGLDALLCALEEADAVWKSEFQRNWGVLEDIYAVALDRKKQLGAEDWKLIEATVQRMKHLLAQVYTEEAGEDE
jgi:CRISPR/Cas system CSM-associated protein Csm2 small subunit